MSDKDKRALITTLLWTAAIALMCHIMAPYWAKDRVERAQRNYIAEKMESYEDIEIAKALRIMRWLRRQEGGQSLEQ